LADRVQVHDGLIPVGLQEHLTALVTKPIWAHGWKSNAENDKYSFWHAHFAGGDLHNRVSCETELDEKGPVAVARLWDLLRKTILQGHEPLRAYGNAHTFGCEGYIHVDNRDSDNYFSTIIYTNKNWKAWWGGETLFYGLDQKDIIKACAALPFRIVTFPGHIPHKANAPARDVPDLRTCIVFKSHLKQAPAQPTEV
jgi:SM-20-related protein